MIHSVHLQPVFPKRFVCHVDTLRAAQITARLLAERFPGMVFGYDEGPDCRSGDCHPSIRDSALSHEVQQLVAALNPTGLISKRLMGNTIGRRALAAFVAQDNKKN